MTPRRRERRAGRRAGYAVGVLGVYDSGFGGLSVLRHRKAMLERWEAEHRAV